MSAGVRTTARRIRGMDLFSGIGVASLAMEAVGMEVVAHSEIEPFPNAVLEERFPGVPNYGDVTKFNEWPWDQIGHIDVVTSGSPCQDLSVAGKRAGLSGERSGLFYDSVGAFRRSGARFFVWENVVGAMSSNRGQDFGAILDALAGAGALDICWRILDAQGFGVPQRRRRVFLVADFAGECAREILFEREGESRNPEAGRETRQEAAGKLENRIGVYGIDSELNSSEGVAGSLGALSRSGGGNNAMVAHGPGPEAGEGIECATGGITHALTAAHRSGEDGSGRGTPIVACGSDLEIDKSAPLTGRYHKRVNTTMDDGAIVVEPEVYGLKQGQINSNGSGVKKDATHSLDGSSPPAVAFQQNQRDEVRLMGGDGRTAGALSAQPSVKQQNYIAEPGLPVREAIGFSAGNSADARSMGEAEEVSPPLKSADSGNRVPSVAHGVGGSDIGYSLRANP